MWEYGFTESTIYTGEYGSVKTRILAYFYAGQCQIYSWEEFLYPFEDENAYKRMLTNEIKEIFIYVYGF